MVIHNFNDSLAKSHAQEDAPWWESVYRKAFPTFLAMHSVRNDGWAQRGGIDRIIILASGKNFTVDEKVRSKDYDDILLEFWSDEQHSKPGWIAQDLACDFIAYAFVPSQRCYLLPFQQLRRAWLENRYEWVKSYKRVHAENFNSYHYTTVSVPVPIPVLLKSICNAMTVTWSNP
jgi:hypothetical protein